MSTGALASLQFGQSGKRMSVRRGGIVATSVLVVLSAACGSAKPPPPKEIASISARCPDLAKADEVAAFDFAKEYQLSRDAADKLKAAFAKVGI